MSLAPASFLDQLRLSTAEQEFYDTPFTPSVGHNELLSAARSLQPHGHFWSLAGRSNVASEPTEDSDADRAAEMAAETAAETADDRAALDEYSVRYLLSAVKKHELTKCTGSHSLAISREASHGHCLRWRVRSKCAGESHQKRAMDHLYTRYLGS